MYDGNTNVLSGAGFDDDRVTGDVLTFSYTDAFADKNVGTAKDVNFTGIAISGGADQGNYSLITLTGTATANITIRTLTITAPNLSKYCGQIDPSGETTDYEEEGLVAGEIIVVNYSIDNLEVGPKVVPVIATPHDPTFEINNYHVNYINGNLTIKPVTLDLSNAQTPRSTNEYVTIEIGISDESTAVAGVEVTLNVGGSHYTVTSLADGIATFNLGKLAADLYEVTAQAGGCSVSDVVFLPIYNPDGGFVTGGGWIDSPVDAMSGDFGDVTGKANFGLNAKYKTGKNNMSEVDGNTNFQFKAGDLHFESSSNDDMSLVISGSKATYTGTGTVNGSGNHKFRVIAVDGDVNGGGGADKFRIMIWKDGSSSDLLYDNKRGTSQSSDDATVLGGGSIVIHTPNGKKLTRIMSTDITSSPLEVNSSQVSEQTGAGTLTVKVMPNPTSYYFTVALQSLSKEKVKLMVTDITGRVIEQRTNVSANSTIQLGNQYHPGIYIAQFQQGTDKVTVRLIKEGK